MNTEHEEEQAHEEQHLRDADGRICFHRSFHCDRRAMANMQVGQARGGHESQHGDHHGGASRDDTVLHEVYEICLVGKGLVTSELEAKERARHTEAEEKRAHHHQVAKVSLVVLILGINVL
eukprot:TRINITY_DN4259_c0_g1_i3.p2 TRINITY_DN4259_c0_g1~~TRINITY_DN4259_c0_g1_i3.p2  ORF type:complete len:121 (-),score=15.93 TRINITY_DN4259_c0_g1_i3:109-471(-)